MSNDPVTPPKMNGVAALDTQSEPKGPRRRRIRGKTAEASIAAIAAMSDSIAPEDSLSHLFVDEKELFVSSMLVDEKEACVDAAAEAELRGRLLQAVDQAAASPAVVLAPEDSLVVDGKEAFVDAAVEAEHRGRLLQAVEQAAASPAVVPAGTVVPAETGEGSEAETVVPADTTAREVEDVSSEHPDAQVGEDSIDDPMSPAASFNYLHPPHDDTIEEVGKPDTIVEVGAPDTILEMEEPDTFVEVKEPLPECEKLVLDQATYN